MKETIYTFATLTFVMVGTVLMAGMQRGDDEFLEVEVALCVRDCRQLVLEQDRGIVVGACGIDQPANPIAESVMVDRQKAKALAGDGLRTEVVKIRFPRKSIVVGKKVKEPF